MGKTGFSIQGAPANDAAGGGLGPLAAESEVGVGFTGESVEDELAELEAS